MTQKINTAVSVSLNYDHKTNAVSPKFVTWNNKIYPIVKIGLHHTYRNGLTLYHVFSVVTQTLFLRLVLDTDNLHWTLEEISDGLCD